MLKNFLKIAYRNLLRFKTYTFINIFGLAVGIACFLTLTLFILDELSYDKFNKNYEQIYRVLVKQNINGNESSNSKTPGLLGQTLLQQLPETENYTRISYFGQYRHRKNMEKFFNGEGMFSRFIDENIARLYESEEKAGIIASVFSVLAIFIASLGVFGLSAFVTEQRTKEIGIRKALGASVSEIIILLSKEFIVWVLAANIIASPVSYYIMKNWLQNFAFRISLNLWEFILPGIAALIIALFTISFHSVKAARANPVESLKYE